MRPAGESISKADVSSCPPEACCLPLHCEGRNFRPSALASSPAEHLGEVPAGESLNCSVSRVVRLSLGLTNPSAFMGLEFVDFVSFWWFSGSFCAVGSPAQQEVREGSRAATHGLICSKGSESTELLSCPRAALNTLVMSRVPPRYLDQRSLLSCSSQFCLLREQQQEQGVQSPPPPLCTLPASGSHQIRGFAKPEVLSGSLCVGALHTPPSLRSGHLGGGFVLGCILQLGTPQRIWALHDKKLPLICFKSAAA